MNQEVNTRFAEKFKQEKNWNSLNIENGFVEDSNFSGKDISLKMQPNEFQGALERLYDSIIGKISTHRNSGWGY